MYGKARRFRITSFVNGSVDSLSTLLHYLVSGWRVCDVQVASINFSRRCFETVTFARIHIYIHTNIDIHE